MKPDSFPTINVPTRIELLEDTQASTSKNVEENLPAATEVLAVVDLNVSEVSPSENQTGIYLKVHFINNFVHILLMPYFH